MIISSARNVVRHLTILIAAVYAIAHSAPAHAQGATQGTPQRDAAQLEQLVAPIALYPDALLSQVLMASTYPLEIVEAQRWASANPGLGGDAIENALQQQKWDSSVKALTTVPQTLQMMNDKLSWTQQLGDAFLAQQEDVLKAVQRLRARADANGQLQSTPQQTVTRVAAAPSTGTAPATGAAPAAPVYTIEPTTPGQYYVPVYDPGVVYGAWPYPDYAPFYWTPPGYAAAGVFGFTAVAVAGAAIWGGVDWRRNNVNVNVNRFNQFNRTNISNNNWNHNPAHRGGVPYRDRNVSQKFGDPGKAAARDNFRGKADVGRQNLATDRARSNANIGNPGNRAAGANQALGSKQVGTKQPGNKQIGNKQVGNKQIGNKQAGNIKQGANRPSANKVAKPSGARQAAQPTQKFSHRPAAAPRGMTRANTNLARGGHRGGARMGGGRRR